MRNSFLRWPLVVRIELVVICCWMLLSAAAFGSPAGIGWTPYGLQTSAGYIAPDGKLILFDGGAAGWTVRGIPFPHTLVPGSPIVLRHQAPTAVWPTVITVSPGNKLIQIVNAGVPQILLPAQSFPVGARLELAQSGPQSLVFAVDGSGDLWCADPATNIGHKINSVPESFPFGSSVAAVGAGAQYHVFAVDQFGTLHCYSGSGAVWSSVALAGGLIPGTSIAADVFPIGLPPVQRLNVAAIDPAGNLILWSKVSAFPWSPPSVVAVGQSPGSPLEIGNSTFGPMLSTISSGGNWTVWIYEPPGVWTNHTVGSGFFPGAPIACAPAVGTVFTIDPLGRLVCANWTGSAWSTGYAMPLLAYTPQLISREFIPNPVLSHASVTLINSSDDPLLVQIVDLFDPRQPAEEKIPARGQLEVSLARESGGTLEEVFLIPSPGGVLVEQTDSHPIPAEQRFTLVLWSDKETYKVLPFKKARKGAPKSVTEGFSRRSQISLGVIPVAPGELLHDGELLDLVQIAKQLNNPGAVVHFAKPSSEP